MGAVADLTAELRASVKDELRQARRPTSAPLRRSVTAEAPRSAGTDGLVHLDRPVPPVVRRSVASLANSGIIVSCVSQAHQAIGCGSEIGFRGGRSGTVP